MDTTAQFNKQRKADRVLMRVPVEVCGTLADGSALQEETHTGIVGPLGAMVRMSRALQTGTKITVTNRLSHQTAQFRVVWAKDYQDADYWEIGLESVGPLNDFWGVRFPPVPKSH